MRAWALVATFTLLQLALQMAVFVAILAAFEEEGWPSRIDDPLPPQPEQDSKRRLSDTIKCLNRKQASPLIHFRGDGTGEGVVWDTIRLDSNSNGTE